MTMFKRILLSVLCMILVSVSLPYVMFRDIYFFVDPIKIYLIILAGSSIAVYNLSLVFLEADRKHYVLNSKEFESKIKGDE